MPELQPDAVDRLAQAFDGQGDDDDSSGSDGVVVKDVVNEAPDTDPENDEGPPERP